MSNLPDRALEFDVDCHDADDPDYHPDPAKAAERILEFVSWFGDGEIFGNSDFPLFSRDLEAVARALGTARVEWGVRKPTRHFGIKVDKSSDEASARRSVEMLHDTERCLNANPKAEVVRRTVIETEWTPAPHPRNGS